MIFEIVPGRGVGPLTLGMSNDAVRAALAPEPLVPGSETLAYAFGNSLQVDFDADGHLCFIGAGFFAGCGCDYELYGRHVGHYGARELYDVLATKIPDPPRFSDDEIAFDGLGISLWDADPQYDYLGGESRSVWGQIAVWRPRR